MPTVKMERQSCRWRSLAILLTLLSLVEVAALKGTQSARREQRRLQKDSKSNDDPPTAAVKTYCDSAQEGKVFVTNNVVDVFYKYEMVITTFNNPDVNQLAADYDKQIQKFLIKWLLLDECGGNRRNLQSSHVMPIRGIGNGAVDYALVGKKCEAFTSDQTQNCYQLVGSQSIYLAEDRLDVDESELKFLIWETLMVGLNFDAVGYTKDLAGVILGVQFIKGYERNPLLLTQGTTTEGTPSQLEVDPEGRSGVAKFGIALVSIALIAAGVLVCCWVYENRDELGMDWQAMGCMLEDEQSLDGKIRIKSSSTADEGMEVEAPVYLSSPTATAPSIDSPTSSMGSLRITPVLTTPSSEDRDDRNDLTAIEDNIVEVPAETPPNEHGDRNYEIYDPNLPFSLSNGDFETPTLEEKQHRTRVTLRGKKTPDTVDL